MYEFVLIIHIVACTLLILIVLLQSGKGAGLNLFGGGGETLFSAPSGSSFMRQFTSGLAITFGVTSLFLTVLGSRSAMRSVTNRLPPMAPQQAPQTPGQQAAPAPGGPVQGVKPGSAVAPKAAAPAAPAPSPAKK